MLICIYIYSYNAIRLWYKLYSEPILAYAFPVPLAFASHLLSPTAREAGKPTITRYAESLVTFSDHSSLNALKRSTAEHEFPAHQNR